VFVLFGRPQAGCNGVKLFRIVNFDRMLCVAEAVYKGFEVSNRVKS